MNLFFGFIRFLRFGQPSLVCFVIVATECCVTWNKMNIVLEGKVSLGCQTVRPNGFALYFSLGFETLSTEMLITKLNVF